MTVSMPLNALEIRKSIYRDGIVNWSVKENYIISPQSLLRPNAWYCFAAWMEGNLWEVILSL